MPTREQLRTATRHNVMAAAGSLFSQRGFKGTTIRDIAEAAGVSVGSVMAVGDKSGLLVAMFDRAILEMQQSQLARVSAGVEPVVNRQPVDEIMMGIFEPFLSLFAAHMDLAREYGAILMSGNHKSVIFQELAVGLTTEIGLALEESGMPTEQVPVVSKVIYLSYLGTLFVWAGSGLTDNSAPLHSLRSTIAFLTQKEGQD